MEADPDMASGSISDDDELSEMASDETDADENLADSTDTSTPESEDDEVDDTGGHAEADEAGDELDEETEDAAPQVQLSGEELFIAQCSACHGADALGTEIAPEVQHPTVDFTTWVVRNGFSGAYDSPMPAYDEAVLSDSDLNLIIEYLRGLPEADTSEGLYLDYCANCHGADARGGPAHKHIAGKDEFDEILRKGKGGDQFSSRTLYMPKWTNDELSSDVIDSLQDYVGSLPE
jgi:mono/diheme cytochrome c family protein